MKSSVFDGSFDSFYTAHYGDTVAMTYGFTADLGEAQDIAQEAFCRAWQRWRDVSAYDNPVAWVRRVATNLAHSRWRRLKIAAGYLVRERPEEHVPPLDPDHVAVVAALRKLPADQRKAVVLHYLADMPVADVAQQLAVPVGTVKSWLYRARAALAEDLRVDVRGAISTPPSQEVVDRARRRQRARTTGVALSVLLAVAGAYGAIQAVRPRMVPPPQGQAPVPTVNVDPMRAVNWAAVTMSLDTPPSGCPSGRITLTGPPDLESVGPAESWPKARFTAADVSLGDLTGDGRAEAVLIVTCLPDENADDMTSHVLVVRRQDDGSLRTLGWTGRPNSLVRSTWVADGVLYADTRPHPSSQTWRYQLGRVDGWVWNGGMFAPEVTTGRYPGIALLDLRPVAGKLACGDLPSPELGAEPLAFGADLTARDGDRLWTLRSNAYTRIWAELDRPGRPYALMAVGCATATRPEELAHTLVIFDGVPHPRGVIWRGLDAVPAGDLVTVIGNQVSTDTARTFVYSWDGKAFTRR